MTNPTTKIDQPRPYRVRGTITLLLTIWAVSLVLRLLLAHQTLADNSERQIFDFNFDTREYVHLAHNLAAPGHAYNLDNAESRFFSQLRTPGYPAFCALFFRFTSGIPAILYAQAFLGSFIPPLTALLCLVVFQSRRLAVVGGLLAAFSCPGIGLSGILLSDLLFAFLVVAAFGLLFAAAFRKGRSLYLGAALALCLAMLVKPALLYVAPIVLISGFLFAQIANRSVRWRLLTSVALSPLLVVALWSYRNHRATGEWIFCTVDAQNLRQFMVPITEERLARGGVGLLNIRSLFDRQKTAMTRDLDDVCTGRVTPAELARRQKTEAMVVLKAHPVYAIEGLICNSFACAADGWAWTPDQLRTHGPFRLLMLWLNYFQMGSRIPIILLGMVVILEHLINDGDYSADPTRKRDALATAAFGAIFLYFFFISGTSFCAGSRILYPVEFAIILIGMAGTRSAFRLAIRARERLLETDPEADPLAAASES